MSREPIELSDISERRQAFDAAFLGALDRVAVWLVRHWLLAMNVLTGLLTGLAFVAPLLTAQGLSLPAQAIYFFYSFQCHQLPQRSYFVLGQQVAQCQRNTAIYGTLFLAGIAFGFLRQRLKPLDWRLYGLLILPMAVDGGTQLFGWRESNWELRTVTGALFGAASVWLAYPYVEQHLGALQRRSGPRAHRVVLYGKEDCSLCDKARVILERLQKDYPLAIEEVDITEDAELVQRYQYLIPVVHIDGHVAAVSKVSEVWLRQQLDSIAWNP